MKNFFITCLVATAAWTVPLSAATTTPQKNASTATSNKSTTPTAASNSTTINIPQKKVVPKPAISDIAQAYTRPGNVAFQNDKWVGNDHLYNLSDKLGLVVEIITPAPLLLTDAQLRESLVKKFNAENFEIVSMDPTEDGGLPSYLHVLVMAYPMGKNIVAYIALRLFESIDLHRVKLGRDIVIQAITWERQTIIESDGDIFAGELKTAVDDLVNTFIDRWKYFEKLRNRPKNEPTFSR